MTAERDRLVSALREHAGQLEALADGAPSASAGRRRGDGHGGAEGVAHRYPAASFPEITGIRLTRPEVPATLVNLSATGVLVECESRQAPGRTVTVLFDGAFSPSSIDSHVVRCEVAGIAPDGSLRYHLGLAFGERIALPDRVDDCVVARAEVLSAPPLVAAAAEAMAAPVLRNRW